MTSGVRSRLCSLAILASLTWAPNSFSETPTERLARLYPQLSPAELREKIRVTRTPFEFYRSFVALFYDELGATPLTGTTFAAIANDTGVCIGDAHPENFGVILNDRGESVFTVNDVDDATPGPIFSDFLRLLAGISIYSPSTPLTPLVQTYVDALQGRMAPTSTLVAAAIQKSQSKGFSIARKELRSDSELKRDATANELSPAERNALVSALAPIGLTLVDAYRYKRLKGGSFGTTRIPTLVDSAPGSTWGGKRLLVEFKSLFPSSVGAFIPPTLIPDARVRVPQALTLFQRPYGVSQIFRVLSMQGVTFLQRPRWSGNVDVELDDWSGIASASAMLALYQNEAAVIGRIHREGARFPTDYITHAVQLSPQDWVTRAQQLAERIQTTYQAVRIP